MRYFGNLGPDSAETTGEISPSPCFLTLLALDLSLLFGLTTGNVEICFILDVMNDKREK